jgi:hypothetical protein
MGTARVARRGRPSFSVDEGPLDLQGVDFARYSHVIVAIAVEALGSANSHIDISLSLLDVAWAIEKLAAEAETVTISVGGYFNRQVTATFRRPRATFAGALSGSMAVLGREGFLAACRDAWEQTLKVLAEGQEQATWTARPEILRVLSQMLAHTRSHAHLPTGGGQDFSEVNLSHV